MEKDEVEEPQAERLWWRAMIRALGEAPRERIIGTRPAHLVGPGVGFNNGKARHSNITYNNKIWCRLEDQAMPKVSACLLCLIGDRIYKVTKFVYLFP